MEIISDTKYLVDTNIFIYGYDAKSPYHKETRSLLQNLVVQDIDTYVTLQNIVEFCNVLIKAYKLPSSLIVGYAQEILLDFKIIIPKVTTINLLLNLLQKTTKGKLYAFDLFLAATMLDNGITHIITANEKDFADIQGISVYNPWRKE
jgi:predicted nucleic acid-binding protein